jgi:hypothetical protein
MKKLSVLMVSLIVSLVSCQSLSDFMNAHPRDVWNTGYYANAPDVYYITYRGAGTIVSERGIWSNEGDYSEITDFTFSKAELSFVTSRIPYSFNNTLQLTIEYNRASSSSPKKNMLFAATYKNIGTNTWRISIDSSEDLTDFLLNMPENFSEGAYITVVGEDASFMFPFPGGFKDAYRKMEETYQQTDENQNKDF